MFSVFALFVSVSFAESIKGDGYEAVTIPKGTFDMGCTKGDSDCRDNEKPVHKVTISNDFWCFIHQVLLETKLFLYPVDPSEDRKY